MNKSDYLDKYFEGSLTEKELKAFNDLLLNDSSFKEAFEFQKELQDTLVLNDRQQTKKEIQNWDTTKNKRSIKPWLVAASIIILFGTSWQLFFNTPASSNEELYANYFEPYENVIHPIVRGENTDDLKAKAFIAYEAKDYDEALNTFNIILNESDDTAILFYKANALLQLNKTDEAISIFTENHNIPEMLQEQQQWYLALAYIKADANNKAKLILEALIDHGNYKKKEAEQLLKQLTSKP